LSTKRSHEKKGILKIVRGHHFHFSKDKKKGILSKRKKKDWPEKTRRTHLNLISMMMRRRHGVTDVQRRSATGEAETFTYTFPLVTFAVEQHAWMPSRVIGASGQAASSSSAML
jgi:hypothetical protein